MKQTPQGNLHGSMAGTTVSGSGSKRPRPARKWTGIVGYLGLLVIGIGLFLLIRIQGEQLQAPPAPPDARPVGQTAAGDVDVVGHVITTLTAVIGFGFCLGRVFRYLGQPPVIGEVVAGILLGPSCLSSLAPEWAALLIPSSSKDPHGLVLAALKAISQLGVILYMFLVGLELNTARLANRAHAAVAVSHSSIIVPFVLGATLALGLFPVFSHDGVPFTSFALFMGSATAITAFPILARILTDRNLDKTELGTMALGCAAADDVTAWCLLALVVGVAQAQLTVAFWVAGGTAAFIAFMFLVVRPILKSAVRRWDSGNQPLPALAVSGTYLALMLCALATEKIGVHAVFGAFLFGAVIPHQSRIAAEFSLKLREPATVLLLPAFFALTGMRTEIALVSGWQNWAWCAAIVLVATVGKFGGTLVAARLVGLSWRDSSALGMLMNTRGLMELIVLNIGLDLGVISPTLFAMMVIMALATTAATAPALLWLIPPSSQPP